jgi:cell division protease FtsH
MSDTNSQKERPTEKKPKETKGGSKNPKFPFWIYAVLLLVLISLNLLFSYDSTGGTQIPYSTFLKYVEQGYIKTATVRDGTIIYGEYSDAALRDNVIQQPEATNSPLGLGSSSTSIPKYSTTMIDGHDVTAYLQQHEDKVQFSGEKSSNFFDGILVWVIPIAFAVIFWVFIMKRMNPGQQMMGIGKSKASLYDKETATKVTFKDVAGLEEAKEEVEEIVQFLKSPEKFTTLGGTIPKGALLVGPPGTGKTLLAKATAGEADVPFFSLSGSDFVEMFVGVGAARVRDLFKEAKAKAPCIIFIDEIDAIGRMRGKGQMMGANDERENTLNQLLAEMDGFNSDKAIIIMAATNRPDVLDTALLRPGRFDRQIVVDKPDLQGRIEILNVHIKKIKLSDAVDIKLLASQTPGFAGAELANLCNEAALLAARRNKTSVEMIDFQDAIERVIAGLEKKNKLISPKEREIVAYHESGHAIVGWYLEHTDPVIKVSIVPRGIAALGYTLQSPLEDRFLMRTEELIDKICGLLGGRVAEEIIFGKISTGAQNDLERITRLAFAMVADYGMSEELGYISLRDSSNPDSSYGFNKIYSDNTAQKIDVAVRRIIKDCHKRTYDLLVEHKDELIRMSEELLKVEIMGYNELKKILGKSPHEKYPEHMFPRDVEDAKVVDSDADDSGTDSDSKNKEEEADEHKTSTNGTVVDVTVDDSDDSDDKEKPSES